MCSGVVVVVAVLVLGIVLTRVVMSPLSVVAGPPSEVTTVSPLAFTLCTLLLCLICRWLSLAFLGCDRDARDAVRKRHEDQGIPFFEVQSYN